MEVAKVQSSRPNRPKEENFLQIKVQQLKNSDSRRLCKIINKMSGKPEATRSFTLEHNGETLDNVQSANALKEFYISVNADIPPPH